jgi:hypothetical protein
VAAGLASRLVNRREALVLRAFALWTVLIWAVRITNILGEDHSIGFKVVHALLAVVSIAFAMAAWAVVRRVRERS